MRERFDQCAWSTLSTGSPALEGALAHLDGDIVDAHEVGTHSIFVVRLRRVNISESSGSEPGLAYFARDYHILGRP